VRGWLVEVESGDGVGVGYAFRGGREGKEGGSGLVGLGWREEGDGA
jgi:hypothetical protein